MIWEFMQKGMASAGWLVGFVVILGLFLVFIGLIGLGFMAIFGGNEEEDEETPSVSCADSVPGACRPHLAENSPPDCFPGARCLREGARERLAEKVNGEGARTRKGKRGEEDDL